jgi:hypothetical protein
MKDFLDVLLLKMRLGMFALLSIDMMNKIDLGEIVVRRVCLLS